ncbi:MAG: exodeoxyribonuclease VII small subunit [Christensenellaceae bacterium]|jgi:exodeoxyribonuclease VII small subunit
MNFEAQLKRLDEILVFFEKEDIPLDEALALYEEGIGIIRACNETLTDAQKKIIEIEGLEE